MDRLRSATEADFGRAEKDDAVFELKTCSWKPVAGVANDEFFERLSFFRRRSGTVKIDALAEIFLRADSNLREQIRNNFREPEQFWKLVRLVAHEGRMIESKSDVEWFRKSLAIAAIEGGRYDFRDTITALITPRYGAERVGIETGPWFDEIEEKASAESRHIFASVRSYSAEQLTRFAKSSGPVAWLADFSFPNSAWMRV